MKNTTSTLLEKRSASSLDGAAHFSIEDSIGYQMRRVVTLLGSAIEHEMAPLGITDAQWKPLLRLYLEAGTSTVAGLARGCSLDAGAMTRMLDRLEAKNLCRRARSLNDRRVVELELTDEGKATAGQIPDVLNRLQDVAAVGFDPAELALLKGFLLRMSSNLHAFESDRAESTGTLVPSVASLSPDSSFDGIPP